jgi:hypothetical protein
MVQYGVRQSTLRRGVRAVVALSSKRLAGLPQQQDLEMLVEHIRQHQDGADVAVVVLVEQVLQLPTQTVAQVEQVAQIQ